MKKNATRIESTRIYFISSFLFIRLVFCAFSVLFLFLFLPLPHCVFFFRFILIVRLSINRNNSTKWKVKRMKSKWNIGWLNYKVNLLSAFWENVSLRLNPVEYENNCFLLNEQIIFAYCELVSFNRTHIYVCRLKKNKKHFSSVSFLLFSLLSTFAVSFVSVRFIFRSFFVRSSVVFIST